ALHARLPAEDAFGAHLTRYTRHLARECRQLVDHRVDGVLEREHLALRFDRDLPREVALRYRGRDVGDVAHLAGEVVGHGVHVLGEALPGTRHTRHVRLTAEHTLRADLARDANHLASERVQLIHHLVDHFLDLEDLAAGLDGDLACQIADG